MHINVCVRRLKSFSLTVDELSVLEITLETGLSRTGHLLGSFLRLTGSISLSDLLTLHNEKLAAVDLTSAVHYC